MIKAERNFWPIYWAKIRIIKIVLIQLYKRESMKVYTIKDIKDTDKNDGNNSWWEYIFLNPIVYQLSLIFANYTTFSPNQITIFSLIFGLLSAYSFLIGTWNYLIIGAFLFEFSFILDCIDGRIARLKGLKSKFGGYLDIMTDFTKYFFIILSLTYGQYLLTGDISFLLFGYIFMFAELAFISNSYIIHFYQPEDMNKKDDSRTRYNLLKEKYPLLMKLKTIFDPENKLYFIPLASVEAETICFFIAPILIKIKLGIILGSILLFLNMFLAIIFNFSMKKDNVK